MSTELLSRHNRRRGRIDAALAPSGQLRRLDDTSTFRTAHAWAVGRIEHTSYHPQEYSALWGPLQRYKLDIRISGRQAPVAFNTVLADLVDRASGFRGLPDSALMITWPSRDTACASYLLKHGFAPVTVLALHAIGKGPSPPTGAIRITEASDVPRLTTLATRLHKLEVQLGALPDRKNLTRRIHDDIATSLTASTTRFWVALSPEREVVGFVQAQEPQGAWIETQVAQRPAAYVSRLYVAPGHRSRGAGRDLVQQAHATLAAGGAKTTVLHHTLHNPCGTTFWARQGYRPALTTWYRHLQ